MILEKDSLIEICSLSYSIENEAILKDINLKIKSGEFVGLIGPNGAGKTTLLKCINGIYKPKGRVIINKRDIKSLGSKKTAMAVSFMQQNTSISFPFSAFDIVMMGRYPHLKKMRSSSKEDYKIARESMEYTDTLKFEKKPITVISGGERQRVLFAKVLTQQTDIMMLDEPTASLDIRHQEQIFKYSRELVDSGKTVIAAVHDLKIASRYCSKLVLMKEGEIIAEGLPEEVLTSENIFKAYNVHALVYKNNVTGLLDFYIGEHNDAHNRKKIHVIGGGGSASGIIRYLFERGYIISAGVFSHGDSDLSCAQLFNIDCITTKPFCEISDASLEENIQRIKEADLTILCNMPFGKQNLKNLEAAKNAGKLVIIEDEAPETRDFSGGKALELYQELKEKAFVTNLARLHEVI